MADKFFDKKLSATPANKFAGSAFKIEITLSQQLAEKLQKPIMRKFEKHKVHSSFL